MTQSNLRQELDTLFGEESVKMALAQEILAERYTIKNPIVVRKSLERFQRLKNLQQQKQFVERFDKDLARAFICSLLCGTASKVVMDLATRAINDKRSGYEVLGGKIIQRSY